MIMDNLISICIYLKLNFLFLFILYIFLDIFLNNILIICWILNSMWLIWIRILIRNFWPTWFFFSNLLLKLWNLRLLLPIWLNIRSHSISEILNFRNLKLCVVFFCLIMLLNRLHNIWPRILTILNF
jgi:hypothetical protein